MKKNEKWQKKSPTFEPSEDTGIRPLDLIRFKKKTKKKQSMIMNGLKNLLKKIKRLVLKK